MLGLAPAGATGGGRTRGGGLGAEEVVQRQAQHRGATDAQDVAAGEAEVLVAEVFAEGAGNAEHGRRWIWS
jgi:hypothetical protein